MEYTNPQEAKIAINKFDGAMTKGNITLPLQRPFAKLMSRPNDLDPPPRAFHAARPAGRGSHREPGRCRRRVAPVEDGRRELGLARRARAGPGEGPGQGRGAEGSQAGQQGTWTEVCLCHASARVILRERTPAGAGRGTLPGELSRGRCGAPRLDCPGRRYSILGDQCARAFERVH